MSRDHKIDRKQFLTWSLAAAGGVMIGCTTSESGTPDGGGAAGSTGTAGSSGNSGSTGGSGGATAGTTGATGGSGGATGGTTGTGGSGGSGGAGGGGGSTGATANCSTKLKVTITSNHGHVLNITLAEIMADKPKTYSTKGTAMHDHFVQLTAADFTALAAGKEVRKPSCNEGHEHEYIINCTGTDGVGMNVANMCGDMTAPANRTCGESAAHVCPDPPYPA